MGFKLQPTVIPTYATAGQVVSDMFTNQYENSYNKITHGGGMFTMNIGDVVHRVQPQLLVVFAGYSGHTAQTVRQVLYFKNYAGSNKDEKKALPDCMSNDGITPNDNVLTKQATKCSECPHSKKVAGSQGALCKKRKEYLMYVLEEDENGDMIINYDTPYVFDVPSRSLFADHDPATGSVGFMKGINMQLSKNRKMVSLESNVFELGFYDGTTSPLIKLSGLSIPDDVLQRVLTMSKTSEAQRLIGKNEDGSPLVIEYKKRQELPNNVPAQPPARPAPVTNYATAFTSAPPAPTAPPVITVSKVDQVLDESQDKLRAAADAFML
jgi:hypothetical protein